MLHLSDKELDLLSQEAAKQYDPRLEHSPGSWEKLEQQLTGNLGRTRTSFLRGYRRIPFLYAPVIVLLVGVTYFMVKQGSRQHGSANTRSDTASLAGPPNSSPPGVVVRAMPSTDPSRATDDKSLKKDQSPKIEIPQNNSTLEKKLNAPSSAARNETRSESDRPIVANSIVVNSTVANKDRSGRNSKNTTFYRQYRHRRVNDPSRNNDNPASDNTVNDNAVNRNPIDQPGLPYSPIATSLSFSHIRPFVDDSALKVLASDRAAKKTPVNLSKKKDRFLHINNPLQIGLLYAPDFTTVKSVEGDKPGHSLGLTLSYQILSRLSVNTGLLWTRKNYTALADDFHPPPGSWFNNNNMVQLHYVEGSVDMLEIPLNIRYDFKLADNSLFYLSGGVSSYLVGDENCLYFYENFGMNRRAPEKQEDPENYWFAALNLAMGIEKPISRSFSIQAEPYLKLPLSGVGIGNVQLNSFGINFSLKYTPVLGKSRH